MRPTGHVRRGGLCPGSTEPRTFVVLSAQPEAQGWALLRLRSARVRIVSQQAACRAFPKTRQRQARRLGRCKTMPLLLLCRGRTCADGCEGRRSASMLATTFHYAATRRITEIGLLVALVGGLVIALGSSRRAWVGLGGLLIAVGLAAALVALHFGVSPYRRGR